MIIMKFRELLKRYGISGSKSYHRVGDVLVVRLSGGDLENFGKILCRLFHVKAVVNLSSIQGWERKPQAELICGESAETTYRENGCLYRIDPTKVMLSKGNSLERMRIASMVVRNERILDMFAGIGYFTIPMGCTGKPSEIIAIEKNEEAFRYLKENIRLNKLKNVRPVLGDNREVKGLGTFDRILMGYLPHTEEFLEAAKQFSHPLTIIHFHNTYFWPDQGLAHIRKVFPNARLLEIRKVKEFGPKIYHFCFDFMAGS